jgi:hypothetical protein
MSKTIVKHGGGAIAKSDYKNALAVIRQADNHGASLSPAVPEIFDLYCFCAVHDKPYTLRFVRQASGLLRFKESMRNTAGGKNTGTNGKGYTLRLDYFENLRGVATPCAWCGNGSFHHCSDDCGALVCGGRMEGNIFHCRKSCGAVWVGEPMREVEGSAASETRRTVSPSRNAMPGLNEKPRLLLPAGCANGKRQG